MGFRSTTLIAFRKTGYLLVRQIGVKTSLLAGVPRQSDNSTETKVIMVLFAELLLCQSVQSQHLCDTHSRDTKV